MSWGLEPTVCCLPRTGNAVADPAADGRFDLVVRARLAIALATVHKFAPRPAAFRLTIASTQDRAL